MKRLLTLLLTAALLTCGAQSTKKVLFIGNSYTYVNDLPGTLQTLALGCGDTLYFEQSTPGGCTFQNHLSNATTTSFIQSGGWDNVILQEQSQLPSFPIAQVQSQCFPYAQQLCDLIRNSTPDAEIVFYMTWGRKNGDASNCANYPPLCTYEGMDSLLYWRYLQMAEDNHATVSPVGRVWHVLRDTHPEIELYSSDESHPSVAGTYAAAVTFYTILYKRSPMCISNNLTLDAAAAQAIRETVERIVFDSLDFWYQYSDSTPEDPDAIQELATSGAIHVYPNPSDGRLFIELPEEGDNRYNITIHNMLGAQVLRTFLTDDKNTINVQHLPSGIYTLSCCPENKSGKVLRTKFVKE